MNVLITGASRGIGQTIANLFLDKGHVVWIPTREELDLSKPVDLKNRQFDIIINNAGITYNALFQMSSFDKMKEVFDINEKILSAAGLKWYHICPVGHVFKNLADTGVFF